MKTRKNILQLIDSTNIGGAEKLAVTLANDLYEDGFGSHICVSRKEGALTNLIHGEVGYLFLERKNRFDFKALKKLKNYVLTHEINILHAHSTSFFLAWMLKIMVPEISVIWHVHSGSLLKGNRIYQWFLKIISASFRHVITVNKDIANKCRKRMNPDKVSHLFNYVSNNERDFRDEPEPALSGINGKRVVCLANLKQEKDHLCLLRAFKLVHDSYPNWTLHLVGKDYGDAYSLMVIAFIKKMKLDGAVFLYGEQQNISAILKGMNIGVLSSVSEGLPMALLEYGVAGLPVVATDVGECKFVLGETGISVPKNDNSALAEGIIRLIKDPGLARQLGRDFQKRVKLEFSKKNFLLGIKKIYGNE